MKVYLLTDGVLHQGDILRNVPHNLPSVDVRIEVAHILTQHGLQVAHTNPR